MLCNSNTLTQINKTKGLYYSFFTTLNFIELIESYKMRFIGSRFLSVSSSIALFATTIFKKSVI